MQLRPFVAHPLQAKFHRDVEQASEPGRTSAARMCVASSAAGFDQTKPGCLRQNGFAGVFTLKRLCGRGLQVRLPLPGGHALQFQRQAIHVLAFEKLILPVFNHQSINS